MSKLADVGKKDRDERVAYQSTLAVDVMSLLADFSKVRRQQAQKASDDRKAALLAIKNRVAALRQVTQQVNASVCVCKAKAAQPCTAPKAVVVPVAPKADVPKVKIALPPVVAKVVVAPAPKAAVVPVAPKVETPKVKIALPPVVTKAVVAPAPKAVVAPVAPKVETPKAKPVQPSLTSQWAKVANSTAPVAETRKKYKKNPLREKRAKKNLGKK